MTTRKRFLNTLLVVAGCAAPCGAVSAQVIGPGATQSLPYPVRIEDQQHGIPGVVPEEGALPPPPDQSCECHPTWWERLRWGGCWHYGYPEYCRPMGSYMRVALNQQIGNGYAAQMTLYRCDFVTPDGHPGPVLNPSGLERLERISTLLAVTGYPIVIEVVADADLNAARRQNVLTDLKMLHGDVADDRVVVGRPASRGLAGDEAVEIQKNVLRQTQAGSMSAPAGSMNGTSSAPSYGQQGSAGAAPGTN